MLHFGDLAYAESTGTDWEHWSRQNEALASRVPYMVSIGNHEYDYLSDDHHNDPSVTDGNYSVGTYVLRKIHQFTTVCLGLFCDVSIGRSRHSGVPGRRRRRGVRRAYSGQCTRHQVHQITVVLGPLCDIWIPKPRRNVHFAPDSGAKLCTHSTGVGTSCRSLPRSHEWERHLLVRTRAIPTTT